MHIACIIIYLILLLKLFKNFNFLSYMLIALYVIGCASSIWGFDSSFVTIVGITITASDITMVLCVAHYIKNWKIRIQKNVGYVALWLYFLILMFNFFYAFFDNINIANIIANVRKYFICVVPWIVCASRGIELDIDKFKIYLSKIIWVVIFFCVCGWGMYFVGLKPSLRVIPSGSTLLITIYAIYSLNDSLSRGLKVSMQVFACFSTVILLQHNSVWVASLAGIIVVLLANIYSEYGINKNVCAILVFVIVVLVGLVYLQNTVSNNVVLESLNNTISKFDSMNTGTIGHRRKRWAILLESLSGIQKVIGQNFSIGTSADGVNFSAHSAYISTILHSGYLGFIFFITTILWMFIKAIKLKSYLYAAMITTIAVYWYAYEPDINVCVILGVIMYYLSMNSSELTNNVWRNLQ